MLFLCLVVLPLAVRAGEDGILSDPKAWRQWPEAIRTLWTSDRPAFVTCLGGKHPQHSALAADVLEQVGEDGARWAIQQGLTHPNPRVRAQSASLLGRTRVRGVASKVALLLSDESEEVQEMAARALSRIGTDAQVPALAQAAQSDKSRQVRKAAALALAWLGTRASGEALIEKISLGDGADKNEALKVLTGQDGDSRRARAWWEEHRPASLYTVDEEAFTGGGRRRPEPIRYPGKDKRRAERARVLYLFDVSGSIPNCKTLQKELYSTTLRDLPKDVFFDAIAFSLAPRAWKGFLVAAEIRANRRDASDWIAGYDGMSGTTPLSDAIRLALTNYDVDEVVIFTDGGGNIGAAGKDMFDYVQAYNVCRRVRLRAIPVGNANIRLEGGVSSGYALARLVLESGGSQTASVPGFAPRKTSKRDP